MNVKIEVWNKVKELDITFPLKKELFAIIDQHIERIEFVNDHVGVRDFLFLAENGTHYTSNFFVAINVECEKSYSFEKNLQLFMKKYDERPLISINRLVDLFENSQRTLYIGIGFKESEKFDQDEVIKKFFSGEFDTQEEILKDVRLFPDWYQRYARNPNEVRFLTVKAEKYINDVLKPLENAALKNQLNDILKKENLTNNDKFLLKEMVDHLIH